MEFVVFFGQDESLKPFSVDALWTPALCFAVQIGCGTPTICLLASSSPVHNYRHGVSGTVYRVDRQPLQTSPGHGHQLPQPQTPLPVLDTAYLDALGAEGWELVSYDVDHEHAGMQTTLIFKRPKQ